MTSQAHDLRVRFTYGPLSDQLAANANGRLAEFVQDADSEPIAIFSPSARSLATTGEWYGEHVGKWLLAACKRASWSDDPVWYDRVTQVADALISHQEPDGYLGTYASKDGGRFTDPTAAGKRTWDLWIHAYNMLGLLASTRLTQRPEYAEAATGIGELILATFADDPARLLQYGNHQGLSALVVIEPLAQLSHFVGDPKYAQFALALVAAADKALGLCSAAPHQIATGKIYQLLWVMVGMVALDKVVRDPTLMMVVTRLWNQIRESHLSPVGGPWGGVATHKEVFNPPGYFDPCGLTETCSTLTWMQLTAELYSLSGERHFLDCYHQSLWNALLGAADPNGRDWIYFSFPNGQRNNTYHWACCKSSGALALEDAAQFCVRCAEDEITVQLVAPIEASCGGTEFQLEVSDDWDRVTLTRLRGDKPIRLKCPSFLGGGDIVLAGNESRKVVDHPQKVATNSKVKHLDHHGQTIVHEDYLCISRGPFVYATGLIDGYKRQETLRIAQLNAADHFRVVGPNAIDLVLPGRSPIRFEPYYRAGGRGHGTWRSTWLQVAWQ